jgi:hypothetical protein
LRRVGESWPRPAAWLGLPTRWAVLGLVAYVLPGIVLLVTVGQDLVFFYPDTFGSVGRAALVVLVPAFWWAAVLHYRRNTVLLDRFYHWRHPLMRVVLVYPCEAMGLAALVAIAPIGWIAVGTWLFGTEREGIPGRIVVAERFRPGSRGCDQPGAIELLGSIDSLCLEGHGLTLPVRAGQAVVASGRESPLGFVVRRLVPAAPVS